MSMSGNYMPPAEENLSSLLPTINKNVNVQQHLMTRNRSINQSQHDTFYEMRERGMTAGVEQKRVGSAYMNRRP